MRVKISKNTLRTVVILLCLLLLGFSIFKLLSLWEFRYESDPSDGKEAAADGSRYFDGIRYVQNDDIKTVLFIGVDKYEAQTHTDSYNNDQQADFLMLLLVDEKAKSCTALHLNRDTMADIRILGVRGENAGTFKGQLALSHTYGSGKKDSCRNTVKAVSDLLYGARIDHYIAFTFDAVAKVNDLVGGVTVTVPDDLTPASPEWVKGATLTLKGDEALKYVRARSGLKDSSNTRRMERQRQYLSGLQKSVRSAAESGDISPEKVLKTISDYMVSECTADQLSRLYERWENYEDKGFITIAGEAKKGEKFMEFYADEKSLKQLAIELFYVPSKRK